MEIKKRCFERYSGIRTSTAAAPDAEEALPAASDFNQECAVLQEDLLRQLLIDSKAYGSLLGSGGVGDPGRTAQFNTMCCPDATRALMLRRLPSLASWTTPNTAAYPHKRSLSRLKT